VTDKGVILVDAKMPGWGEAIQDKLKTVTDKPVTTIIITHSHFDHTGSIDYFGENVEIVTHENTRTRMKNPNPFKTFKDKMTLFEGKDQIDLYYFGRGHTDGDILVVFKSAGVMHSGDLFAWKQTPILDTQGGSSAVEYGKTLAKAAETIKGVDTVITGHSPLMTFADFKEYADFNNDFIKWVESRIRAGKSVKEAAAEFKIDPKYEGYSINTFMGGIEGNIQAAYNELQK
jgi:cyclase